MHSIVHIMILIHITICKELLALPMTVGDSIVNAELNGKELIKMGTVLNKPLLTLLGETFVKMEHNIGKQLSEKIDDVKNVQSNIGKKLSDKIDDVEKNVQDNIVALTKDTSNKRQELKQEFCKLKSCTEWTEWSACSANVKRTFGASTRTRTCGVSSSICPLKVAKKEETESRICQGTECKSNEYTKTKNKFCIRLSKMVKKSWKDAQEECHQDGGHLINIDSALKVEDVNDTLQKMSVTEKIWIDGTRTIPNGEWKYEYNSEDTTFSKWYSSEPGSSDDCRAYVLHHGKRWWWGRPCTDNYYFLCEML
ncbi:uncharacterized protein LOC128556070 [Mercenaria mercenaria]|uniref:uncharacterized protein LOC128556070 n=1 Tax=Mercenaria mercenaria TaxID=6596 RepID=UPI00234F3183|nr:uncharacterized protein LOC128556070 [Mercenaria mercenaria]